MKKIVNFAGVIIFMILLSTPIYAYANGTIKQIYSKNSQVYAFFVEQEYGTSINFGTASEDLELGILIADNSNRSIMLSGTFSYPNYDNSNLGVYDLQWIFTPDDTTYESISGTIRVNIVYYLSGTIASEDTEDEAIPSFEASSITMQPGTSYYPTIKNKVSGSILTWTTSDKTIATVNKTTGKVKAKKSGTATITCKVETPYDETFTLTTKIKVTSSGTVAKLAGGDLSLKKGKTSAVSLSYDTETQSCYYKTSDSSVATVEAYTGVIKAKGAGDAYITCTVTSLDNEVTITRQEITVTK